MVRFVSMLLFIIQIQNMCVLGSIRIICMVAAHQNLIIN